MPPNKYLQSSISTLRYPHAMTQSLARLELKKPLFLWGDSRVQDSTKNHSSLRTEYYDIDFCNLSEQSRCKLKRIQANPFLKSYRIYPKIQNSSLSPKLQKILIHQRQQYIPKPSLSLYRRFPTFGDQQVLKIHGKERSFTEEAEKIAEDIYRRQMDMKTQNEKQSPIKEQVRNGSRHFTDYQKFGRNVYSRYQPFKTQKLQQIFYSQTNCNEAEDHQHYLTNLFPPSFKKISQQNQTIIQKLQDHNAQESEVDKILLNQKNSATAQRNTGAFGFTPMNQEDVLGVIQQITLQGQNRRQQYKTKQTYPQEIKLRSTTYFSVKLL